MVQKEGLSLAMDIIQESFREEKLQNFHEKRTLQKQGTTRIKTKNERREDKEKMR